MNILLRFHASISVALSFLAFACLFIFGVKSVPGGPFVSFRGDILPQIYTLAALGFALAGYRHHSVRRRMLSLCSAGLAAVVSVLTAFSTCSFFYEPYARGVFFQW